MTQREQEDLARQHKEQGAALLAKGKLEPALRAYELAIEASNDVAARRKAAEVLARLGRNGEAVRAYQLLVGRFAAEGRLLEAIALCKVILQLDPKHVETQAALARFYAQRSAATASRPGLEQMPSAMTGAIDFSSARAARPSQPTLPKPRRGLPELSQQPPGERPPPPVLTPVLPVAASAPAEVELAVAELPATPLFSELPAEVMQALLEKLTMLAFPAGETIIEEGETGRSLFVIASGSVEVVRRGANGARVVIDKLPEGAFFGEIGLVADVPRLAAVIAVEDCVLLEVSRELVAELGQRFPSFEPQIRAFYKSRLLANLLRSSPLFSPLDARERAAVVEHFKLMPVEKGEVLLKQGAPGPGLFLLLRGRCGVTYLDVAQVLHTLPEMSEGAVMGEISLIRGTAATATVTALTKAVLLLLEPGPFVEHLLSNPQARALMTSWSEERLQRTDALDEKQQIAPLDPAFL